MHLPAADAELVQIVDASLAEAARRAGEWLVCKPGCTQCCLGAFAINTLDALRLRTGMAALQASAPALAEEIGRRACAWIAEHSPEFPGDAATGQLGSSDADQQRFEEFANEAACPALDPVTGHCDIYAWRPMTCRVFGPPVRMEAEPGQAQPEGFGHCELCFHDATPAEVAACEMPVPHAQEAALLELIGQTGETVVAFALLP
jgi:Fe-S-cluster containining protein